MWWDLSNLTWSFQLSKWKILRRALGTAIFTSQKFTLSALYCIYIYGHIFHFNHEMPGLWPPSWRGQIPSLCILPFSNYGVHVKKKFDFHFDHSEMKLHVFFTSQNFQNFILWRMEFFENFWQKQWREMITKRVYPPRIWKFHYMCIL